MTSPRLLVPGVLLVLALAGGTACATDGDEEARPGTTTAEDDEAPSDCTPGYGPCLPSASDYDCSGGSGDGPEYVSGPVEVTGSDPYGLDRDGDGTGCDS